MNYYGIHIIASYLLLGIFSCKSSEQNRSVTPEPGYELVTDWPRLPDGFILGNPTGLGIDSRQHLFVFHRAGRVWPVTGNMPDSPITANTVLEIESSSGSIINSWGAGLFIMPHGLTVDKDDNLWLTDVALHQVFKFNRKGELLMKLGEAGVPGDDSLHFDLPTDVAVASDGSFYVSDGYGNSRVVKFSSTGDYLLEWGRKGDGPGEFNTPHAIDIDQDNNVYVADRENNRVQVFNSHGKFLAAYEDQAFERIFSITVEKGSGGFKAIDYKTDLLMVPVGSDVLSFDSAGQLKNRFGRSGHYEGPVCWYHDIASDNSGNLYLGDIFGNRIQKFRKN
jgi:peptidylamidoglycolate lyase